MSTQARTSSRVEILESRIAPAASITYIDVDGIMAAITSSKGSTADLEQVAIFGAEGSGQELRELRLSDLPNVFKGANISIVKGTAEDFQFVNAGFINAAGIDLGKITVDGDLGRIVAGDNNSLTPAAKALTLESLGVMGLNTQDPGGSLNSKLLGRLGSLTINGDLRSASLTVLGVDPDSDENVNTAIDRRGDIGSIFIGGDMVGGEATRSGSIYAKGDMGNVTVIGSVMGGTGAMSGSITSERTMGTISIGGDVAAGLITPADFSARISSVKGMGSVTIAGSLTGGVGIESGSILTQGSLGNLTILGDIVGGPALKSGTVGAEGKIGKIAIGSSANGGNITGGAGEQSGGILSGGSMKAVKIFGDIVGGGEIFSGSITSAGKIASVFVDGSITGGSGEQSGAIGSSLALGAVNVMGDLVGGAGENSGNIVSTATIDSVSIQGSVVGGSGEQSGAIGCLKTLGPVEIGGDLKGGSVLNSGAILCGQNIVRVTIDGSIVGSTGVNSGIIDSAGAIGSITVRGNLSGGDGPSSGSIHATEKLSSVSIEGDVNGGLGRISATIIARAIDTVVIDGDINEAFGFNTGSIIATEGDLGSLVVRGAVILVENSQNEQANRLQFSAGDSIGSATFGNLLGTGGFTDGLITARNTIGKVTVENSARFFQILAGYTPDLEAVNSRAHINKVIIGTTGDGHILGVDIAAGVTPSGFADPADEYFGTPDDSPINPFSANAVSRIGSVMIKGNVFSSVDRLDHYGIVAGRIDFVEIGGEVAALTPGLDSIDVPPESFSEFTIREVSFSKAST